jgi:hypothetical protein
LPEFEKFISDIVSDQEVSATAAAGAEGIARRRQDLDNIHKRLIKSTSLLFDTEAVVGPSGRLEFDDGAIEKFRIAALRTNIRSDNQALSGDPDFAFDGLLKPRDGHVAERLVEERGKLLAKALKLHDQLDLVSFCEFALPPAAIDRTLVGGDCCDVFDENLIRTVDHHHEVMAKKVYDRAIAEAGEVTSRPFIFYGSSHCNLTRFNIGVVSPGSKLEDGYALKVERTAPMAGGAYRPLTATPPLRSGPIVQKKRFPARRAGERARVPDDHAFRTYFHPLGLICVLICSDSIDLNQFWNIVRINDEAASHGANRVFMVLVPSYNTSPFLETSCRDLSAMARTNVLVTNAVGEVNEWTRDNVPYPRPLPPSQLFFDGMGMTTLLEEKIISYIPGADMADLLGIEIDVRRQREIRFRS